MYETYEDQYGQSPTAQWSNSASIVAGADVRISWESQLTWTKRFLPFDFTRIVNNGESDITFYPNQDDNNAIFVPKGTIISMDRNALPALSSFRIKNMDSVTTITANKIYVNCHKEGQNTDSVVERLHRRLFGNRKPQNVL